MKKLLALLGAVAVTAACIPRCDLSGTAYAADAPVGLLDENITWELDGGTLTFTGTGVLEAGFPIANQVLPGGESPPFEPEHFDKYYNLHWQSIAGQVKEIVINEGITKLDSFALCLFPELEAVTLPDTLETLNAFAFAGCPNLKTVNGGDSVSFISGNVFYGDEKLCSDEQPYLILGGFLLKYGGSDSDLVLPDNIRYLAPNAFENQSNLRSVTLPDGLQEISGASFSGCTGLNRINIPETVKQIGMSAFSGCTGLTEISIPDTVSEIGMYAFSGCSSLTSLEIPEGIGEVIYGMCKDCVSLKEFTVPDSVTMICSDAFSGCSALETVRIPESVQQIDARAFADCGKLKQITLPETVKMIDPSAFSGCETLRREHTENGCFTLNGILLDAEKQNLICTIPDGITVISNDALRGQKSVEISCPDSLRYIRADAFADNAVLKCINLNEGCETIGENALSNCRSLSALTIPASVKGIGKQEPCYIKDIYGKSGTAAEQFARENKIAFHDAAELNPSGRDMTLDLTKDVWRFNNSSKAFGGKYYLSGEDRQALQENGISTENIDGKWDGSCVGISIAAILAKNGIIQPEQLQAGAKTLAEVEPTETVQSFINYYQCTQGRANTTQSENGTQRFYRLVRAAEQVKNGESPLLIVFALDSGSHGVIGYGQENGAWEFDGKSYDGRILIWDSNFPDGLHEESCIYYDSRTLDYCIPYYGVSPSDQSGGIFTVCNDISLLNAYPHPLTVRHEIRGDINVDGQLTVSDAILLARICAEDMSVRNAAPQDMDGDGFITVTDVTEILKMLAKTAT